MYTMLEHNSDKFAAFLAVVWDVFIVEALNAGAACKEDRAAELEEDACDSTKCLVCTHGIDLVPIERHSAAV
eukprot:1699193-Amphidinium_carterae.1